MLYILVHRQLRRVDQVDVGRFMSAHIMSFFLSFMHSSCCSLWYVSVGLKKLVVTLQCRSIVVFAYGLSLVNVTWPKQS